MFLYQFNEKLKRKFESEAMKQTSVPYGTRHSSLNQTKSRIYTEIDQEHHQLLKYTAFKLHISQKDLLWLILELGLDQAVEHVKSIKDNINS